jgi:AcrR family transcriptional regulator
VVERAGSSVGSLYHHFGGKSELYLALWQEHQQTHEEAASKAVARARQAGVTDTTELFCTGARAFLEGSWLRRDLALLFFSGDGPPGFEVMKRRRGSEWVSQNDALLGLPDTSLSRLYAAVLTSLIGEGAREVAAARNRRQANRTMDAVIEYARRVMTGGEYQPAAPGEVAPPATATRARARRAPEGSRPAAAGRARWPGTRGGSRAPPPAARPAASLAAQAAGLPRRRPPGSAARSSATPRAVTPPVLPRRRERRPAPPSPVHRAWTWSRAQ